MDSQISELCSRGVSKKLCSPAVFILCLTVYSDIQPDSCKFNTVELNLCLFSATKANFGSFQLHKYMYTSQSSTSDERRAGRFS